MSITLTEEHRYIDQDTGNEYPGTTTIIKEAGFMGWHSDDEYYLLRGQYVHDAMRLYFKGTLDIDSLLEGVRPYVDSALEFIAATGYKPEHVEKSLFSSAYFYCGTIDAWPLLDWKTGGKDAWHVLQMAAYFNLAQENGLDSVPHRTMPLNVHLRSDGKLPKCEPYNIGQIIDAKKVFLSARVCYEWKKQNKRLKEKP